MEKKKIIDELKQTFPEKIKDASSEFGDDTVTIAKDFLLDLVQLGREVHGDFGIVWIVGNTDEITHLMGRHVLNIHCVGLPSGGPAEVFPIELYVHILYFSCGRI